MLAFIYQTVYCSHVQIYDVFVDMNNVVSL